jgi:hypothetical protein
VQGYEQEDVGMCVRKGNKGRMGLILSIKAPRSLHRRTVFHGQEFRTKFLKPRFYTQVANDRPECAVNAVLIILTSLKYFALLWNRFVRMGDLSKTETVALSDRRGKNQTR